MIYNDLLVEGKIYIREKGMYLLDFENEKDKAKFFDKNRTMQFVEISDQTYRLLRTEKNLYTDAEIFFSQFYSHFNFDVPIYCMAKIMGQECLICNNLLDYYGDHSVLDYLYSMVYKQTRGKTISADLYNKTSFDVCLNPLYLNYLKTKCYISKNFKTKTDFYNYMCENTLVKDNSLVRSDFSDNSIKDKIKMRILDCAMYNNARYPYNYAYKITSYNGKYIDACLPLSSMNSAQNISYLQNGLNKKLQNKYVSETRRGYTSRANLINDTKNNELLKKYFDDKERNEFAKQLNDVTSYDIVSDVKENTGYEIDREYQDLIYDNCEFISSLLKDDELVL